MKLQGQAVVVAGASRGLGRAIALAMAEEGANVVRGGRNSQALGAVAAVIHGLGRRALAVRCDVRDPAAAGELAREALSAFGRIDTLVNSAGIAMRRPALEMPPSEWNDLFDTNVRGTFLAIQAALPAMIERG